MKQPVLILGMIILAGATLFGGVMQGRMSRRWGSAEPLQALADTLQELPQEIGPWRMRGSQTLDPAAEAILECAGFVGRQYENRQTGETVTMAVLLGPAGPISVHTPDVCYASQEYKIRQSPERTRIGAQKDSKDELWFTTLESSRLDAGFLRVYYGWSTGGPWSAPSDARFAFAGRPYLYKVQVAAPLLSLADEKEADPGRKFLNDLLPAIRQCLVKPVKE